VTQETNDMALGATGEPLLTEATEFLRMCQAELGEDAVGPARLAEVAADIAAAGTYRAAPGELACGAKLAWRNSLNCIGKAHWRVLRVRDARGVETEDDAFETCVEHLRYATNGGRIRAALTVFPPQPPGEPGWRIWNSQLIRYAGYRKPDGSVLGDPATADFTDYALASGWPGGPGTPFDVLPLVIQAPGRRPRWYPIPPDAVLEVPLSHPELDRFAALGLRWYAHPAISSQILRLGGLDYPAVPFSGWYTATEIGARNLSDTDRYNALPAVASLMGLDCRSPRTLWQDRAQVELVRAVLHSYDQCGISIVDHHFAAEAFRRHERREEDAGRAVHARWRCLISPMAASTTPTFFGCYQEEVTLPNFFPHEVTVPTALACEGGR
jgi:nitric-oxide synthase